MGGTASPRRGTRWRPPGRDALAYWTLLLLAWMLAVPASAQPVTFGSADDPSETLQEVWWRAERYVEILGGPSLVGPQWYLTTGFRAGLGTPDADVQLGYLVRGGVYGDYDEDANEWYDLLRTVEHVRLHPSARPELYLRLGPLERTRLGAGHLVSFFNSEVAWEERTLGAEALWHGRRFEVGAFTDNVLFDGVTGARLAVQPLLQRPGVTDARLRSLQLALHAVTDVETWHFDASEPVTGYNVEASATALGDGTGIELVPYVSFAAYARHGSGFGFGTWLRSDNFLDLGRFALRAGLYYNDEGFLPGYVGSFYQVSSPRARILDSDAFEADSLSNSFAGTALAEAPGGQDLELELRLLFFDSFEFWYAFRRHYGDQPLSEMHLRLFARAGRFALEFGQDRGGLDGLRSLFDDLGDQTRLVFNARYQPTERIWVHIGARYTYERLGHTPSGIERYVNQRRFEPMAGFRFDV